MARGLERGCEDDQGADSLGTVPSGPQPESPVTRKALPPGERQADRRCDRWLEPTAPVKWAAGL